VGRGARRGVAQIAFGTAAGQAVLIAITPILSRLYNESDFAVLQVFTGVAAFAAVLASLRLELAIPLAKDDHQARSVLRAGLIGAAVVACVVWVAGLATEPLWARTAPLQGLADAWWLVPFTLAAIAVFQLISAVLVRAERYGDLATRNTSQSLGTAAAQLGFGFGGMRPLGLLLGLSIGRMFGLASVFGRRRLFPPDPASEGRRPVTVTDMLGALRRFRRFPLVTTWSGLMNVAGQYAPFFVFALLYTEQQTGWLAFTARVLALPVTVIGQAVAQVFIGRGANAQRGATGDLPRLTGLAVKRLAMVGVLPAVALAVLAPWAFDLIFGSNWHRAGQYAQVMAVAFLAQFVAGPVANVFNLLERQGVALLSDSVRLVLVVAAPVVVWYLHGSDLLAVAAYAGVLTFSYLGVLALAWGVLRHA
jgi:O-antigen/teichoic acid export membrane protein